jgi:hypothetical protein
MRALSGTVCLLLCALPAAADEALLPAGRRVPGTLSLDRSGRLRFTPEGRREGLPAEDFRAVRLPARPPPFRVAGGLRLHLAGGGHLTGQLLACDDKALTLRTPWADKLTVPRPAAAALTHLPGWRTLLDEDLSSKPARWAFAGAPTVGPGGSALRSPGQSLEYRLSSPLPEGRAGVNFRDRGTPSGARWQLEAVFTSPGGERALRVTLAGPSPHYEVDPGTLKGSAPRVKRTPGPHRLVVRFSARSLRVTCDDDVLWYTLDAGPGGPLRRLRLACVEAPKEGPARGGVLFWAFGLERAADETPHPPGDPAQDELWLAGGDQLFGTLTRLDRRAATLRGAFGTRTFPWPALTGCFFRADPPPPRTTDGAHVRLALDSRLAPEPDLLEGALTKLDDRSLTLHHPALGELRVDRRYAREVRPLFFGLRLELDDGHHHLGRAGAADPRLLPARAEGPSWRAPFRLASAPARARLVLSASRPAGPEGPPTEVIVNGRTVGYLNRQAGRPPAAPRRLAFDLPRGCLRAGANALLLRQPPDPDTGRTPHCVVSRIALELPR